MRESLHRSFGLPGRGWASTRPLSVLGVLGALVALAAAVVIGPGAVAGLGSHWVMCLVVSVSLLVTGINPLSFRTAGIAVEVVLEGGLLALALLALGPREGAAFWLLATLVLELVQRHYLAMALLNVAITMLACGAAVGALHLAPLAHDPRSSTVAGLVVGATYCVAETLLTDLAARALGSRWRGPLPWTALAAAVLNGVALGAVAGAAIGLLGSAVASVALAVPLCLASRLAMVEELSRETAEAGRRITTALTLLASADSRDEVDRITLDAAASLASASEVTLWTGPPDPSTLGSETVQWYALSTPAAEAGGAEPQAPARWLRAERLAYKIRTPALEISRLETLATGARAAGERIAERDRMTWAARHDPLTGLLNRDGFWQLSLSGDAVSALLLDLDGFKEINDHYGHAVGDSVLSACAHRIRTVLPDGAVAARWGGDEFVVLVPGEHPLAWLDGLGLELVAAVEQAAADVAPERIVSASVGHARSRGGEVDPLDLLQRADAAMYAAKRAGKATVRGDEGQPGDGWPAEGFTSPCASTPGLRQRSA